MIINFCNPMAEEEAQEKTPTYPRQLFPTSKILSRMGEIWFKTDDDELFEESLEYFKLCGFTRQVSDPRPCQQRLCPRYSDRA